VKRRWRTVGWSLGVFLLSILVCLPFVGIASYRRYLDALSSVTWYAASWNASFLGFFSRIFGGSENIPLVEAPDLTRALGYGLSAVLVCCLVGLAWPRHWRRSAELFDLLFSLSVVVMLLISPLGWMYYFPVLLVPLVVVWQLPIEPTTTRYRIGIACAWVLSTIPHALIRSAELNRPLDWFTWAGSYFYALALFLAIIVILVRRVRNSPSSGGE